MNTLKEMGIQQWRLKKAFAKRLGVKKAQIVPEEKKAYVDVIDEAPAADVPDLEQSEQFVENAPDAKGRDLSNLDWQGLQKMIETNEHCPSCGVANTLLGSGDPNADWMFVIDAPTSREVSEQSLFSGRAGQLFDSILQAIGLDRSRVYTSSVFKCAPTENLSATPLCDELVHRQIQLVAPKLVVTFGEFAAQAIIKANDPLERLRDSEQKCFRTNVAIVPTYSPAQMLNDSALKAKVWQDLKKCLALVKS